MTTRCKFYCSSVKKIANWEIQRNPEVPEFSYIAEFHAVTSGSAENDSFFKYTPAGRLEVGLYKEDRFVPGKEYYLDISLA